MLGRKNNEVANVKYPGVPPAPDGNTAAILC